MDSLEPEITCSLPDGDRELLVAVPFKYPVRVEFSSGKFSCRFLDVSLFFVRLKSMGTPEDGTRCKYQVHGSRYEVHG